MDSTLQHFQEVFANDRYARLTGVEIVSVGNHTAVCSLTLDSRHLNARGMAMGGVLFTLADFCVAVAANSECVNQSEASEDLSLQWVSLDSSIHFLAPAQGHTLSATCSALKVGRTTALFQTIIESLDNGKRIAVIETTMMKVE